MIVILPDYPTGTVRFVPKPDEDGKYVSCRATNPNFPDITREDGYIVRVKCKCIHIRKMRALDLQFALEVNKLRMHLNFMPPFERWIQLIN